MDPQSLRISEYTYELPDERIARHPLAQRDQSKLLQYRTGAISQQTFTDLPDILPSGSLLVMNDSRVIRARLVFTKDTGARIEVFCLEPHGVAIEPGMNQRSPAIWRAYLGNAKRWKEGELSLPFSIQGKPATLWAARAEQENDHFCIAFRWEPVGLTFGEVLEACGNLPLPPYLQRNAEESDLLRYQTVYAREEGSVAAPTAGLHFTEQVLERCMDKGISTAHVTLHVGAGTFKPVKSETMADHEMHYEQFSVTRGLLQQLLNQGDRPIVSVGTTSMRTLESLYWLGVKAHVRKLNPHRPQVGQWEPYQLSEHNVSRQQAVSSLMELMHREGMPELVAKTGILIAPGYQFRVVDALVTNFHQPNSTLLLLVAAFIGDDWRKVYDYALNNNFRFLSYGDSSVLFRADR